MTIENQSTRNNADENVENEIPKMANVDDSCPDWAITLIDQLRQVEIILGNIPKAIEWQSSMLKDVNKRIDAEQSGPITEEHSELLFGRITRGLIKEGFSATDIATFINARIGYKGGPKYCSEVEINETLN